MTLLVDMNLATKKEQAMDAICCKRPMTLCRFTEEEEEEGESVSQTCRHIIVS